MTVNHAPGRLGRPGLFKTAWCAFALGIVWAAASYLLMVAIAEATMQGLSDIPFGDVPASTALVLFLPAIAVTIAALIVIRSLTHPKRGGKVLWIAVWVTVVTVCLSFLSWYFERTESVGGTATDLWAASILTMLVSAILATVGLIELFAAGPRHPS